MATECGLLRTVLTGFLCILVLPKIFDFRKRPGTEIHGHNCLYLLQSLGKVISHATLCLLSSSPYFGVCGPEVHLPFRLPEVYFGPLRSLGSGLIATYLPVILRCLYIRLRSHYDVSRKISVLCIIIISGVSGNSIVTRHMSSAESYAEL